MSADVARNLEQTRQGGADLLGLPGWVVEVKRAALEPLCGHPIRRF